jgi:branched-chain amino acid transport system substrate-binding protein
MKRCLRRDRFGGIIGLCVAVLGVPWQPAAAQRSAPIPGAPKELRIGVVAFLSGQASGTFGIPAKRAADVWVDKINEEGGIGGARVAQVLIDEEGSADKVVSEFRRLVRDQKVDLVIGYASSANCLGVSPVAEELKVLTVLFDCGTPRVFEETRYKYVFRTTAHTGIDGIAAARYLLAAKPDVQTVAGLNEDYAWGRDSWEIFACSAPSTSSWRTTMGSGTIRGSGTS